MDIAIGVVGPVSDDAPEFEFSKCDGCGTYALCGLAHCGAGDCGRGCLRMCRYCVAESEARYRDDSSLAELIAKLEKTRLKIANVDRKRRFYGRHARRAKREALVGRLTLLLFRLRGEM